MSVLWPFTYLCWNKNAFANFPPLWNFANTRWAASLRTDFPLRINEGLAATPYFALRIQKKCGWLITHEKAIKNQASKIEILSESWWKGTTGCCKYRRCRKTLAKNKNNTETKAEYAQRGSVFLRFVTKPLNIKGLWDCLQELWDVLELVLRAGVLKVRTEVVLYVEPPVPPKTLYSRQRFIPQSSCCDLHLPYAMCPHGGDNAFQKWKCKHFVYKASE